MTKLVIYRTLKVLCLTGISILGIIMNILLFQEALRELVLGKRFMRKSEVLDSRNYCLFIWLNKIILGILSKYGVTEKKSLDYCAFYQKIPLDLLRNFKGVSFHAVRNIAVKLEFMLKKNPYLEKGGFLW